STFINSFTGRACTKTGDKPGVTKGKQWIRLNKQVELLDTPGILWPKFENSVTGLHLAMIGSLKEELLQHIELCSELINFLNQHYKGLLEQSYDVLPEMDSIKMLTAIAIRRHCKKTGDEPDLEKAAMLILDDYRAGKIGRITLDSSAK
ncbi:MAG: 50S ribosome-binding GTPase, partial [Lachnoclostridium sp.]|nr:50S ribosome-binding GTPase [Lachnoclostridium sp.]